MNKETKYRSEEYQLSKGERIKMKEDHIKSCKIELEEAREELAYAKENLVLAKAGVEVSHRWEPPTIGERSIPVQYGEPGYEEAEYASFEAVLMTAPDYIKLDMPKNLYLSRN